MSKVPFSNPVAFNRKKEGSQDIRPRDPMLSVEQNAQKARKPNTEDTPADNHPTSKLSQEQEVQESPTQH